MVSSTGTINGVSKRYRQTVSSTRIIKRFIVKWYSSIRIIKRVIVKWYHEPIIIKRVIIKWDYQPVSLNGLSSNGIIKPYH